MTAMNSPDGFSFLVRDVEGQDERFLRAFSVLARAIEAHAFPCCSLAITYRGKLVAHKALGRFTYEPSSTAVSIDHLFDIASVTKIVATTAMAMILYERGVLDLEAPVAAIVPEFFSGDSRRAQVTLRMLLAHSSGLPAYDKLFLRVRIAKTFCARPSRLSLPPIPGHARSTVTSVSLFSVRRSSD